MRINVKCQTKDTLALSDLEEFQGDLKERTDTDKERLTSSIKDFGFSFPFFVWHDEKEIKNWVIDGHGRMEVLSLLESEGYEIPLLPVIYIKAKSKDEAKSLLLHANSLYGETNREELLALIEECGANIDDLSFPEFNLDDITQIEDSDFTFTPALTPNIDTSEVQDRDVVKAGDKVFDVSKNDPMTEFICGGCGGKIYVKRSVITRYLKGEHV